jgi:hypothetical protein
MILGQSDICFTQTGDSGRWQNELIFLTSFCNVKSSTCYGSTGCFQNNCLTLHRNKKNRAVLVLFSWLAERPTAYQEEPSSVQLVDLAILVLTNKKTVWRKYEFTHFTLTARPSPHFCWVFLWRYVKRKIYCEGKISS